MLTQYAQRAQRDSVGWLTVWHRLAWMAVRCRRMANQACCGVVGCGRVSCYSFHSVVGVEEPRCGLHGMVYWPVFRPAIAVALVAGTILMLINQPDVRQDSKSTLSGNC